ncbi:DUF1573 domain-containing protein [Hymenobacter sp. J193]|uniref:DUF1573 domain-containing protein n=1 Tax=Hymenobacter sp. J193 TaxID=2898429 RepID=UPI0021516D2F|nr:DUF1573 domain-containing protein [Hymenobacter sp. J193]MCR5890428.1 DUF1573 domain-containing protein [Hymenobacter sp. J193]
MKTLLLILAGTFGFQAATPVASKPQIQDPQSGLNYPQPGAFLKVYPQDNLSFGTRPSGGIVEASFTLKNMGADPVIIRDVQSSCGCTVAQFNRQPLKMGNSRTLVVRFNTDGRIGQQNTKVVVRSNSTTGPLVLSFSGILEEPAASTTGK